MGKKPYIVNIRDLAGCNNAFRVALWTGDSLQATLMSINPGDDIGTEMHPTVDQYIMVSNGRAKVYFGDAKDRLRFVGEVGGNNAIFIPAGTWHNIVNSGGRPLKLISVYAPPNHPYGAYQSTKIDERKPEKN